MANRPQLARCQARNNLPNVWRSSVMSTCLHDPLFFCYTVWCPYCAAFELRGRALHWDWSRFACCGGLMPCSGFCGEATCPRFCAALEAVFCFTCSVAVTRFHIQDELGLQNTACDNCIFATMFWLQYLNFICSLMACLTDSPFIEDAAILTDRIADIAYCRR
ncbi:unnamed protein product [Calypogeia fissa]